MKKYISLVFIASLIFVFSSVTYATQENANTIYESNTSDSINLQKINDGEFLNANADEINIESENNKNELSNNVSEVIKNDNKIMLKILIIILIFAIGFFVIRLVIKK